MKTLYMHILVDISHTVENMSGQKDTGNKAKNIGTKGSDDTARSHLPSQLALPRESTAIVHYLRNIYHLIYRQ